MKKKGLIMNCVSNRLLEGLDGDTESFYNPALVSVTSFPARVLSTAAGCGKDGHAAYDLSTLMNIQRSLQAEACRLFALRERLVGLGGTHDAVSNMYSLHYLHALVETHALSSLLERALVEVDLRAVKIDAVLETIMDTSVKLTATAALDLELELKTKVFVLCNDPMNTVTEAFFKLETLEAIVTTIANNNAEQFEAAMTAAVFHKDAFGLLLLFTAEKEHSASWKDRAFFPLKESVGAAIVMAYEKNFIDYLPLLRFHPKMPSRMTQVIDLLAIEPASPRHTAFVEFIEDVASVTCVRVLLATNHIDPSASANEALYKAVSTRIPGMVRALLADSRVNPADTHDGADLVFTVVCREMERTTKYSVDIFNILRGDGRVDPSARNNEALASSILNGNSFAVRMLLAHPHINLALFDPDDPFIVTAAHHRHILRMLLVDGRADPSVCGNHTLRITMLNFAHGTNDMDRENLKDLLADARVNPNDVFLPSDEPPIVYAARHGLLHSICILLADKRVDPSVHGKMALEIAKKEGHAEVVLLLSSDERIAKGRTTH